MPTDAADRSAERRSGAGGRRETDVYVTAAEHKRFQNRMVKAITALSGRLDRMDLNGSTQDLKEIARSAIPLRELAEQVAPLVELARQASVLLQPQFILLAQLLAQSKRGEILIEMLDEATQRQLAAVYLRRLLKPWKPVGAAIWAIFLVILGALAVAVFHGRVP